MTDSASLRRLLLALPQASEEPHSDRRSFKTGAGSRRRTILTLAPDETTVNFMFIPDEQTWTTSIAPEIFTPVPGGLGRMGATTARLNDLTKADLTAAIDPIYRRLSLPKAKKRQT